MKQSNRLSLSLAKQMHPLVALHRSPCRFQANIPRYTVTARVTQAGLSRAIHAGRFIEVEPLGEPDADGWITVRLRFQVKDEACGYLLSFGPEIEVLDPAEAREQIIQLAESVLAFYENRAASEEIGAEANSRPLATARRIASLKNKSGR
jgi:WYL domain